VDRGASMCVTNNSRVLLQTSDPSWRRDGCKWSRGRPVKSVRGQSVVVAGVLVVHQASAGDRSNRIGPPNPRPDWPDSDSTAQH
jgi:hypothetical protein